MLRVTSYPRFESCIEPITNIQLQFFKMINSLNKSVQEQSIII